MKTKNRTMFKPFKVIVSFFLALVMTLGFVTDNTRVFAAPTDYTFFSGNDVLFWDPNAVQCQTTGAFGTLRGDGVQEKIWNYLVDKGLSKEQAAGVMGNMDAESGYTPTRRQANNSEDLFNSRFKIAWGLAQWDGGRRFSAPKNGILGTLRDKYPDLMKYVAPEYGSAGANEKIPEEDLDQLLLFELEYLHNESNSRRVTADGFGKAKNEWETLKLQKTVEDATVFWHNNFEVSSDTKEEVLNNRGGKSKAAYDKFSGGTSASAAAGGNVDDCRTSSKAGDGTLNDKLTQYAWPTYHPKGWVRRMPAYTKAVEAARGDGRYIGDSCHGGGVDCGAWVTILLNDSGFSKEYNHNGKIKDGAGYTVIQKAWAEKNWETLGRGDQINVKDLQPGDVAHLPGHTFLYVGKDIKFQVTDNGVAKDMVFGGDDNAFKGVASASQCGRAPMAGHESMTDSDVTWYRKK